MPTTSSDFKSMQETYQTRSSTTLVWGPVRNLGTPKTWYERTWIWPTTVKRKFPSGDLYLNGTARTTTRIIQTDSGFDYEVSTSPRERRYNASVHKMFYMGYPVVPVEGLDLTAMYNKIRNEVRGEATNLAQMLAEYRQTAKLFLDLAQAFATKGKSLLKKSTYQMGSNPRWKKRLVDPSKTMGSAYLQWTYGASPLMDDMHSAMVELNNSLNIPRYIEGVETRHGRGTSKGVVGINSTVSSLKADWDALRVVRHRCQWRAYIDQNAIRSCLVSHGFGNPLAIAWELVPFSFVVDWWINIGEVLSSLDNMILIDKLYVLESTSDKLLLMRQTQQNSLVLRPGQATLLKRVDTRKVPTTISKVNSFRYKPSVSRKHIANGLALLTQFRR